MAAYDERERYLLVDEDNPGLVSLGWCNVFADVGAGRLQLREPGPIEMQADNGLASRKILTGVVRECAAKIRDVSGQLYATGGYVSCLA